MGHIRERVEPGGTGREAWSLVERGDAASAADHEIGAASSKGWEPGLHRLQGELPQWRPSGALRILAGRLAARFDKKAVRGGQPAQ